MLIEYRSLEEIIPYKKNARKISQAVIELVAKSIKEFGWRQPIVVDTDFVIVVGHARWLAARYLRLETAPVHVAVDLTADQIRAYRLMDNKSHELAGWDMDLLSEEMRALQATNIDLGLTGFTAAEIERFVGGAGGLTDPDATPELPAEIVSRPGDVWVLGNHRVLCGDATDAITVSRFLEGASPVLMVTDPPYGVNYDASWRVEVDHSDNHALGKVTGDDRVNWGAALSLFPGDVAYVWHAGVHAAEVAAGIQAMGFNIRAQIIWAKQHFVFGRGNYHWGHEPCWYAVRAGKPSGWRGDRTQSTLWEVQNLNPHGGNKDEKQTGHSTQKPVELMRRPLLNHTEKGACVYDPFLGSGSTVIACEEHERICYGLEIEPGYCDVIVLRWQAFTGRSAVLSGSHVTYEQAKEGRRQEWQDKLMEEAIVGKTEGK